MPIKVKYENNWQSKTLENLEKDFWSETRHEDNLVDTCHLLRKKPLKDFGTEDLRIVIGQNIGLKYLNPLALETLKINLLAEGDFYEGDLLKSVLTCDKNFWRKERDLFNNLELIINKNEKILEINNPKLLNLFYELKNIIFS